MTAFAYCSQLSSSLFFSLERFAHSKIEMFHIQKIAPIVNDSIEKEAAVMREDEKLAADKLELKLFRIETE